MRKRPKPSNNYDDEPDSPGIEAPAFERNDVRRAAMNLLARREYGRAELSGRLAGKGMPESLVAEVLDELTAEGLQSDVRFAEAFVQARVGRGQGPVRIRMELERRGVSGDTLENALEESETDSASGRGRCDSSSTAGSPPTTSAAPWATTTDRRRAGKPGRHPLTLTLLDCCDAKNEERRDTPAIPRLLRP
jgi:hypothetical protein